MNANTDDTRSNFILPPPAGVGSNTSDAPATATFHRHMVGVGGGVLKPHCYPKKVRRKSSKLNPIGSGGGGVTTASASTSTSKPKYPKKPPLTPEPDAPKIARPCSECGKKFWSWKALFGHMRCHPERQWRGINPPPNFRRPSPSSPSPPDLDDRQHCYDASSSSSTMTIWPHDQCRLSPSPSGDYYYYYSENMGGGDMTEEDHEVAACLLLLANNGGVDQYSSGDCRKFEVGVGFGIREDEMINIHSNNNHRHICSICSRVFSSGRALGGHKRFHCRDKFRGDSHHTPHIHQPPILCTSSSSTNNFLDLNLVPTPTPAPHHQVHSSSAALPTLDLSLGL